jgi:hypothetical protein
LFFIAPVMKNQFYTLIFSVLFLVFSKPDHANAQIYEQFTPFSVDTLHTESQALTYDNYGNAFFAFKSYVSFGWGDPRIALFKVNSMGQVISKAYYRYTTNPFPDEKVIAMLSKGSDLYVLVQGVNPVTLQDDDIVLVKFNSSLQIVWQRKYNSPGNLNDIPVGLANGPAGSILITGNTNGKIITRRYSLSGQLLFSDIYQTGPSKPDYASGIVYSSNGIYVFGKRVVNGDDVTEVLKYNDSLQLQWVYANRMSPAGVYENIREFVVDTSGNAYVAGQISNYPFIVKINGQTGTKAWSRKLTTLIAYNVNALYTDNNGNPFMWLNVSGPDRFYKLDKNLGTISINKLVYPGEDYSNFNAYQGPNGTLIISAGYSEVQNVWNPWCQCFEDMTGYGKIFAKVNSYGNIVWDEFTPLVFDQWVTTQSPTLMAVDYNRFYYMGEREDMFNTYEDCYYGARSTVNGLRTADAVITDDNSLEIYPNPANQNVHLNLKTTSDDQVILKIMNVNGQIVNEDVIALPAGRSLYTLDVSALPDGLYLITLNGNMVNESGKLIVRH